MDRDSIVGLILVIAVIGWLSSKKDVDTTTAPEPSSSSFAVPHFGGGSYEPKQRQDSLSRDEAIAEHWDEIKQYLNGTESVEACSSQSGNCYDLDADISGGSIDAIHFPNGGWRNLGADIDSDGSASDSDYDGDSWDMNLDMNSSSVDDAVQQWADTNGVTID